jgi:hypothetical protein
MPAQGGAGEALAGFAQGGVILGGDEGAGALELLGGGVSQKGGEEAVDGPNPSYPRNVFSGRTSAADHSPLGALKPLRLCVSLGTDRIQRKGAKARKRKGLGRMLVARGEKTVTHGFF